MKIDEKSSSYMGRPAFFSIVTLAFWQLRQTYRFLLLITCGLMTAVTLVCMVPLYEQVAMTSDLHTALTGFLDHSYFSVQGKSPRVSTLLMQQSTQQLDRLFQSRLGSYRATRLETIVSTESLSLQSTDKAASVALSESHPELSLVGYSLPQTVTHLRILQGRLPQADTQNVEFALPLATSQRLHLSIGMSFYVDVTFVAPFSALQAASYRMPLQLVGIFSTSRQDTFWHDNVFQEKLPTNNDTINQALVSREQLLTTFSAFSTQTRNADLTYSLNLSWYYPFSLTHLSVTSTSDVLTNTHSLQVEVPNQANRPPYVQQAHIVGNSELLDVYNRSLQIMQLPITLLTLQILALLIFFLIVMAEMLVEYESTDIAVLRSRGGSKRQIFGAFSLQCFLPGLFALALGPLLAIVLTSWLAGQTLPASEQLPIFSRETLSIVIDLSRFALLLVGIAMLSMMIIIYRSSSANMLTLRQEVARTNNRPLWQRFYLDIFAALIALIGYIFAVYVTDTAALDPQVRVLISAPLVLIAPLFLIIAALLLSLRAFPYLLRLVALLARRRQGATLMLALTQIARAPRRVLRQTLLLMLAVTFTIFLQVLTASQAARVTDTASFQAGATFSGTISKPINSTSLSGELLNHYAARLLREQSAVYQHISGVSHVTIGYSGQLLWSGGNQQIALRAVDPNSFAQTIEWNSSFSSQPLSTLLSQLVSQRDQAFSQSIVPAIVDDAAWNTLHLQEGQTFTLDTGLRPTVFMPLARIHNIPTISDTVQVNDTSSSLMAGGLLVDYQSYAVNYIQNNPPGPFDTTDSSNMSVIVPLNYAWLQTGQGARTVAQVRATLLTGEKRMYPLYDQKDLIGQYQQNVYQRELIGIFSLCVFVPLLLVVVGNLFSSWLEVRRRLTLFSLLRALGTTPQQVARVLMVELGVVYLAAGAGGLFLGILLSIQVIPALIFSGQVNAGSDRASFFFAQNVPSVRLVIPPTLLLVLAALLITCVLALLLMIRIVARPTLGQVLRLNED